MGVGLLRGRGGAGFWENYWQPTTDNWPNKKAAESSSL